MFPMARVVISPDHVYNSKDNRSWQAYKTRMPGFLTRSDVFDA